LKKVIIFCCLFFLKNLKKKKKKKNVNSDQHYSVLSLSLTNKSNVT